VAGTDTHVGKTLVSSALLHSFAAHGKRVIGMKPVSAGCDANEVHEDVRKLSVASNVVAAPAQINLYSFEPAIAPHLAAQRVGVRIDLTHIVESYAKLKAQADVVVVEGAGGFLIPLNDVNNGGDLVSALGLPVILVVGMRLGCLNHALLTVEAIQSRGIRLAAWVANGVDVTMTDETMLNENIAALKQRIAAPLLGIVPHIKDLDAKAAAKHLNLACLG